jgi:DNA (cytosine-5)-methyltransferase 1
VNSAPRMSSLRMSWDCSQRRPIAWWNRARGAWETDQLTLYCEHCQLFSQTFPKWGMTHAGALYGPATSEPLTGGNGSSLLLPTPQARDSKGSAGRIGRTKTKEDREYYEAEASLPEIVTLLSTPNARDWKSEPGKNYRAGSLPREAKQLPLLPTPTAQLNEPAPWKEGVDWWLQSRATRNLEGVVTGNTPELPLAPAETKTDTAWGKYGPAIHRWEEILGRTAPPPTVADGRNGNARLNPELPEWMMGLPDGWVTQVPGLTRKEQLHAIGNGVCPQQAAAALRLLLSTENFG